MNAHLDKRILLVEDESIIALTEEKVLKNAGYEVITAYNAEKAIEISRKDKVDLILMDIDLGKGKMPGTDAAELILREKDIPIVFLSSHTEPEIVDKTEGISSYGYIVKHSGETVLLASIKMAFRLYAVNQELKTQKEHLREALIQQEHAEEELKEKSEELDRFFNASLDLLCIARTDGTFIRLNPEWEEVLGYSVSELEGRYFIDLVHEDDREETLRAVSRLDNQEEVLSFTNRYRCKDGSYRWIEWRSKPIGTAIYAAARDITDRMHMENELLESESKYKALYENAPLPYQSLDADGNFIDVNPTWLSTLGYAREEVIGKNFSDFLPKDWVPHFLENFPKFKARGYVHDVQFKIIHKNGEFRDISFEGCIGYHPDGSFRQTYCVFKDITDQIQAEERLHRIEWMLQLKQTRAHHDYIPEYGDLSALNKDGPILSTVGRDRLMSTAAEYLDLLETSSAVYERNGDYALGLFSSGWCQMMDAASRRLCETDSNREALTSGRWLCHESCWTDASLRAMEQGKAVDIECNGGIHLYAQPIKANGKIIGAINFGYGDPPRDKEKLAALAGKYDLSVEKLREQALQYQSRPNFIIEVAKQRLEKSAADLGFIIEKAAAEENLEEALQDKEFLMQELNHRVKNNLMIISSLISLKNEAAGDVVELSDLARQVDAVRLIHEQLNKSETITKIDVKGYINDLISTVFSLYTKPVKLKTHLEPQSLHPRDMVPIGLILNEIATNAMKYGFSADADAVFSIDFREDKKEERFVLTISNSGKPFPEDVDFDNPTTLGLRLISALVQQIEGKIDLKKSPHPVFTITFPLSSN